MGGLHKHHRERLVVADLELTLDDTPSLLSEGMGLFVVLRSKFESRRYRPRLRVIWGVAYSYTPYSLSDQFFSLILVTDRRGGFGKSAS